MNIPGGKHGNALQAAYARGYEEIVQLLVGRGANVVAQEGKYQNALQTAPSESPGEAVQLLQGRSLTDPPTSYFRQSKRCRLLS